MRVLFIGDIVGTPGLNMVKKAVPILKARERIDIVIANAENVSGGSGMYPNTYRQVRAAGVDTVTMGDHLYKKSDIIGILTADEPICKPANYPATAPGNESVIVSTSQGTRLAVVSLMGRTFMKPVDCPFVAADRVLASLPADVRCIFVDVHAEATGDKYQLLHYLKGRVSALVGTHTHVQTADEQILPEGTAFLCDAGMTGPHAGILGRRIDRVLSTVVSFVPSYFDIATDDVRLCGAIIEIDDSNGRAQSIVRVMLPESALN